MSIVAHDLGLVGGVVGPLITRAERVSSLVFGTAILLVWRLDLGMQSFSSCSVIGSHVFVETAWKPVVRSGLLYLYVEDFDNLPKFAKETLLIIDSRF